MFRKKRPGKSPRIKQQHSLNPTFFNIRNNKRSMFKKNESFYPPLLTLFNIESGNSCLSGKAQHIFLHSHICRTLSNSSSAQSNDGQTNDVLFRGYEATFLLSRKLRTTDCFLSKKYELHKAFHTNPESLLDFAKHSTQVQNSRETSRSILHILSNSTQRGKRLKNVASMLDSGYEKRSRTSSCKTRESRETGLNLIHLFFFFIIIQI